MSLIPQTYDQYERDHADKVPYFISRIFQPYLFYEYGIHTRLKSLEALHIYVDMLHEAANKQNYLHEAVYSPTELSYMEYHQEICEKLTRRLCNRPTRPIMAGPRVIDMLRTIIFLELLSGGTAPRVLEIGPGSSALGSMLVKYGLQFACFEVTQSFFVLQHHLLESASEGDIECSIAGQIPLTKLSAKATLIPWWLYGRYHTQEVPPMDIVVCDRAIGEMLPEAFGYIANTSSRMLADSSIGAFLFSHVGTPRYATNESIISYFTGKGWRHACLQGIETVNVLLHPDSPIEVGEPDTPITLPRVLEEGDIDAPRNLSSAWAGIDLSTISDSYAVFDYLADYAKPGEKEAWLQILSS